MSGITAIFCIRLLVALIPLVACTNVRPRLDFEREYQKLVLFICQILSILIHGVYRHFQQYLSYIPVFR